MSIASGHNRFQYFIFLGIGGIGMSALARYLVIRGKAVLGYDRSTSELTQELQNRGAQITHQTDPIRSWFDPGRSKETLIIWTPAVGQNDPWMRAAKASGFEMVKRAELLGSISAESKKVLAVAGTHGKTTTSAILAHLLIDAGKKGIAFLGGIAQNYQSNFILSEGLELNLASGETPDFSVVEADEFDRSFLWIKPHLACITSVDPDHLDIYQDKETFVAAFELFAHTLAPSDLFMAEGLAFNGIGIGLGGQGEISAERIEVKSGAYCFNLNFGEEQWSSLSGPLPGRHNLMNVIMAVAMARSFGLTRDQVAKSLLNFKGIHRRFNQYKLADNKILIDDYAHHPTELRALLQGVQEFYPDQPHILLFQPHLFSRTRDFAHDFAQVLSAFDRVLLMPIYPARELPIPGVDSDWLAGLCDPQRVQAMTASRAIAAFTEAPSSIFIVAGAGDIGLEVQSLKQKLI